MKRVTMIFLAVAFLYSCNQPHPPAMVNNPSLAELNVSFTMKNSLLQMSAHSLEITVSNRGQHNSETSKLDIYLLSEGKRTDLFASSLDVQKISAEESFTFEASFIIPETVSGSAQLRADLLYMDENADSLVTDITILPMPSESEPNDGRFSNAHEVLRNQGYKASITSEFDEDWFVVTIPPSERVYISADGENAPLTLDLYIDSEGTAFKQFIIDDFSEDIVIENSLDHSRSLYIRASCTTAQNYQILFRSL